MDDKKCLPQYLPHYKIFISKTTPNIKNTIETTIPLLKSNIKPNQFNYQQSKFSLVNIKKCHHHQKAATLVPQPLTLDHFAPQTESQPLHPPEFPSHHVVTRAPTLNPQRLINQSKHQPRIPKKPVKPGKKLS